MVKTTIKGKVLEIGLVREVGDKQTRVQKLIIFTPGYHDGYEKIGRDNQFEIQLLNQKITELNLTEDLVGKIIECECFVDSQYLEPKPAEPAKKATSTTPAIPAKEATKGGYFVNITLSKYTIIK